MMKREEKSEAEETLVGDFRGAGARLVRQG